MPVTMSSSKSITVSIVSHGQQALVAPLLEQLQQHCLEWVDKVVLTANIPEHGPDLANVPNLRIECITNAGPLGFGSNHNVAFAHCHTEWFLVLNPDIRIDADVLGALLPRADAVSGVLAPRIVEPGSRHAGPEPHRGLLTPWEILTRNRPDYRPPFEPAWIPGMFMLLRASAYRQIGGFDERFFMYGEDFDLCARLGLVGWRIVVVEDQQAVHAAQRASRRNWRHLLWHFMSLSRIWSSPTFWRYRAQIKASEPNR